MTTPLPATTKKQQSAQTRDALLDAAEQVFLLRGVASASLEDVARSAGVTRGALYWHFKNKPDLFTAMHARAVLPLDEAFSRAVHSQESPLQSVHAIGSHILATMAHNGRTRRVFTIMLLRCECIEDQTMQNPTQDSAQNSADRLDSSREGACTKFTDLFRQAHLQGQLTPTLTPEQATTIFMNQLSGTILDYIKRPHTYPDLATQAQALLAPLIRGLST